MDLHSHSYCSDGLKTPEALVRQAKDAGLDFFAVTDHESVRCLDRAQKEADRQGIALIKGLEIGAEDNSVHIIVVGIDTSHPAIVRLGEKVAGDHIGRAKEWAVKLTMRGVPIDFRRDIAIPKLNFERKQEGRPSLGEEELAPMSDDDIAAQIQGAILRPDIAQALLARGHVSSIREAFDRYLSDESLNTFQSPSFREIIDIAHGAGGLAFLAHPHTIFKFRTFPRSYSGKEYPDFETLLRDMLDAGLDGIEHYKPGMGSYPADSARIESFLKSYQAQTPRDVLLSAGSDYHGYDQGGIGPRHLGGITYPESEARKVIKALKLDRR